MKKIFSTLFVTITFLALNLFSAGATAPELSPGVVKFKINFKDVNTLAPVPDCSCIVYFKVYGFDPSKPVRQEILRTSPSGSDGVSYGSISFIANADQGGYFGSSYMWAPGSGGNAFVTLQTIDFDPTPFGYVLDASLIPGRIRNFVDGRNMTASHQTQFEGGHDNCYLSGSWLSQGASVEFDMYVRDNSTTKQISFDTSRISNASSFTPIPVERGSVFNVSSITTTPVCTNPNYAFSYWSLDGATEFVSATVSSNLQLIPVWTWSGPGTGPTGKVKFKVFVWDHNAYWEHPKYETTPHPVINGVQGNYSLYDYQNNSGWTDIPIKGMQFVLKSYDDAERGLVADSDKIPVGRPNVTGWLDAPNCRITTDENGEAEYIITNEQLQYLRPGWRIDTDPDATVVAEYDAGHGLGVERTNFDWDWLTHDEAGMGAGLVGVRYIYEGERHPGYDPNGNIHISGFNENDNVVINNNMITDGFEFTFYCYVVPSVTVTFELDGGTRHDNVVGEYPVQKFNPVNSISGSQNRFRATDPGTPHKSGKVFAGWHEVYFDNSGNETGVDPNPFDFNRIVTYSIKLRAVWANEVFSCRWAPYGWDGNDANLYEKDNNLASGVYPTFDSDITPSRASENGNYYKFSGWDLWEQTSATGNTFGSLAGTFTHVRFIPMTGTGSMQLVTDPISGMTHYASPVAINGKRVIYVAAFEQLTVLRLVKTGLAVGESAVFTVSCESDVRKVVLTGKSGQTSVSKDLLVGAGSWTVQEDMNWSWAYNNAASSTTVTVEPNQTTTVTFTNTAKSTTPSHHEAAKNNVFSK